MFLLKKKGKENIWEFPDLSPENRPENTLDFHSPLCRLAGVDLPHLFYGGDFVVKNIVNEEEKIQVYRLRHRIFCEELRWVPQKEEGLEMDDYDKDAIFFGVFNKQKKLVAFLRLILSNGHFMIEREFFSLVYSRHKIRKARDTVEVSRLCVAPEARDRMITGNFGLHNISMLLYKGVYHWCIRHDIRYLYLVVEAKIYRLLRIQGFPCRLIGEPKVMPDKVTAVAAIIYWREFERLSALKHSQMMRWFFSKN
ncbi:MAG: GNAT family N-acetyltransferase [Gammaproteobacteria bacterium]|nr:GNAT family N-acetyltransferase [Gammaproteobacteria bacterium]